MCVPTPFSMQCVWGVLGCGICNDQLSCVCMYVNSTVVGSEVIDAVFNNRLIVLCCVGCVS